MFFCHFKARPTFAELDALNDLELLVLMRSDGRISFFTSSFHKGKSCRKAFVAEASHTARRSVGRGEPDTVLRAVQDAWQRGDRQLIQVKSFFTFSCIDLFRMLLNLFVKRCSVWSNSAQRWSRSERRLGKSVWSLKLRSIEAVWKRV